MTWVDTARRILERKQFEMVHPETGESVDYEWKADPDGEYAEAQDHEIVVPKDGDGVLFDAFTASLMVQVHDGLSPANRERFAAMPFLRAHHIATELARRNA
jgi:hypothetical protein